MNKINVGIVGVGNMGKNHVRLVKENAQIVNFRGVYDKNYENVKKPGLENKLYNSPEELMDDVDAVIIAVPSSLHKEIGLLAAKKGVHALIEKPLALSYDDAKALTDAYEKAHKILMVGHVERFNPAVLEVENILEHEEIIGIEIARCSPKDKRISDTDVIYDLMIHDIDILINALNKGEKIEKISSFGTNSYSPNYKDYVQSIFKFQNGGVAAVLSSRTTESKLRQLRIHCKDSLVRADLLDKTVHIARKTTYDLDVGYSPVYTQQRIVEDVFVPAIEPLKAEQLHFFECIKEGKTPKTDGKSSLKLLKVLDEIKREVYG